jgi:Spy/CpxP family protein refolding chaperone
MSTHSRTGWLAALAAAAIVATLAVGVAYASQQQGGPGQGRRMGQGPGMMMREGGPLAMIRMGLGQLDLTEEQRQQVKTIMGNHQGDFQALRGRALPARRALADAIASGDEAAIRQRSTELSAVQTDTALVAARVRTEIFKILTPEQQQKAQDLRKKLETRMDQRRGRAPRGF